LPVNPTSGRNWVQDAGLTNISGGTTPSEYGRPGITISGYTGLGEGGNSQGDTENVYSIGDTVSDVLGRHTLRTGFQFQYRQITQLADTTARGAFTFSASAATDINPATGNPYTALENFARGFCSACAAGSGTSLGHYSDQTYGAFINDVWQVGHGLTANLGLRWEYASPFVEKDGLEGSFDPTSGKIAFHKVPAVIPTALVPLVNTTPDFFPAGIIRPMKKGFGPRVGLAYQRTPTTVIRTGYGIYFDNTNTNELQFTRTVAPLYFQASLTNQFVQGLMPGINAISLIPPPFSVSANNRIPYTQEWTMSVQQDLGHGTLFELAYTGSATHKLWKRYDQNEGVITQVDGVTPAGPSPFPAFGVGMLTSATVGNSAFNGLSVKVEHRSTKGLYYLANYQWSKNLDNNSGEADSNDTSYSRFFGFDRSYSNFDTPHRFVGSWGYQLPFGKGQRWLQGGIANVLAGGWQFQNIVQLRTGYPFSVTGGSGSCLCGRYVPQRVNLVPGRKSGKLSNPSPNHWFDRTAYYVPGTQPSTFSTTASLIQGTVTRNTLRGPGTAQVDFSAIKNFQLYERLTAQFRAEAFNIINHPNFGNPSNNISNNNFGTVTGTSTDNRDLQFALKILW
jgi:TonB-dependent receptor-like protein